MSHRLFLFLLLLAFLGDVTHSAPSPSTTLFTIGVGETFLIENVLPANHISMESGNPGTHTGTTTVLLVTLPEKNSSSSEAAERIYFANRPRTSTIYSWQGELFDGNSAAVNLRLCLPAQGHVEIPFVVLLPDEASRDYFLYENLEAIYTIFPQLEEYDPPAVLLTMQSPLSICGYLGVEYNHSTASVLLANGIQSVMEEFDVRGDVFHTLTPLQVETKILTWGIGGALQVNQPNVAEILTLAMTSSAATVARPNPQTPWCKANSEIVFRDGVRSLGSAYSKMFMGTVGVPLPDAQFLLFDSWGNPSPLFIHPGGRDTLELSVTVRRLSSVKDQSLLYISAGSTYHAPPGTSTARATTTTTAAGGSDNDDGFRTITSFDDSKLSVGNRSFSCTVRRLTVIAPVSQLSELSNQMSEEPLAVTYEVVVTSSTGKLFFAPLQGSCYRFQLNPGSPGFLNVVPTTPHLVLKPNISESASEGMAFKVFAVPDKTDLILSVKLGDVAGNDITGVPLCDTNNRVQKKFNGSSGIKSYCRFCTVRDRENPSFAPVYLVPSASSPSGLPYFGNIAFPATTAKQLLTTGGHQLDLVCALNGTSSSFFRLRTNIAIHVVPQGEFSCYNGNTELQSYVTADTIEDISRLFYSTGRETVPLARIVLNEKWRSIRLNSQEEDMDMSDWILVPQPGFIYIPLGLLAVMSFGASYTAVSSIQMSFTRPMCASVSKENLEEQISQFIYEVGDNSTRWIVAGSSNPTAVRANTQLRVCHGRGISKMEFVSLKCCDRDGRCQGSSLESPLALLLLLGGILVGIVTAVLTCVYIYVTSKKYPMKIPKRENLTIAERSRIVLAHLLAPWVLCAHCYFIFDVDNISATVLFYLDLSISAIWGIVLIICYALPHRAVPEYIYRFVGLAILCYSQFLLANSAVWTMSSLHLNMALIPFTSSSVLIVIQVFWSVNDLTETFGLSMFEDEDEKEKEKEKLTQSHEKAGTKPPPPPTKITMAPVDCVLAIEYFAIAMTLFMFTVEHATNLSSLVAILLAFATVLICYLYNYSLPRRLKELYDENVTEENKTVVRRMISVGKMQDATPADIEQQLRRGLDSISKRDGEQQPATPQGKNLVNFIAESDRFAHNAVDMYDNQAMRSNEGGGGSKNNSRSRKDSQILHTVANVISDVHSQLTPPSRSPVSLGDSEEFPEPKKRTDSSKSRPQPGGGSGGSYTTYYGGGGGGSAQEENWKPNDRGKREGKGAASSLEIPMIPMVDKKGNSLSQDSMQQKAAQQWDQVRSTGAGIVQTGQNTLTQAATEAQKAVAAPFNAASSAFTTHQQSSTTTTQAQQHRPQPTSAAAHQGSVPPPSRRYNNGSTAGNTGNNNGAATGPSSHQSAEEVKGLLDQMDKEGFI